MDKTICKNWELNYQCKYCGESVYNATKTQVNCVNCGKRTTLINPIGTREKNKNEN